MNNSQLSLGSKLAHQNDLEDACIGGLYRWVRMSETKHFTFTVYVNIYKFRVIQTDDRLFSSLNAKRLYKEIRLMAFSNGAVKSRT